MARHVVATTSEIPAGGNKVVTVAGREIVVFHVNGEFFALLNRCPHEGAPLAKAACVAHLRSDEPGEYQRSRVGELLRCAWHGWEFDMRTGQSYFDPQHTRVRAFPVAVEAGDTLAKGPYVAETFPVTVEETICADRSVSLSLPYLPAASLARSGVTASSALP
jgi:nitrite reductase/ring-hydroxylating ferredoxin subunit